jgi:hypothetical protein
MPLKKVRQKSYANYRHYKCLLHPSQPGLPFGWEEIKTAPMYMERRIETQYPELV